MGPLAIAVGDALMATGLADVVQGQGAGQGVDALADDALVAEGLVVVLPVAAEDVGDLGQVIALPAVADLSADAVGDGQWPVEVVVANGQARLAMRVEELLDAARAIADEADGDGVAVAVEPYSERGKVYECPIDLSYRSIDLDKSIHRGLAAGLNSEI